MIALLDSPVRELSPRSREQSADVLRDLPMLSTSALAYSKETQ
jgi:hypothetical protein